MYDWARDGVYNSGYMTVTSQGNTGSSFQAGSSLFDAVNADSYQIQASYDDPYYGIRALGGTVGGGGSCPPNCEMAKGRPSRNNVAFGEHEKFTKHGIRRKGVRALVDNMEEMPKSPDGNRRFGRNDRHGKHVIEIHPSSELLLGEELVAPDVRIASKHKWKRVKDGFVREQTTIETRDGNGAMIGKSIISITKVKLNEPASTQE